MLKLTQFPMNIYILSSYLYKITIENILNYIDLHRGVVGLTLIMNVELYYSLLQKKCAEKQMLEDFFD